MSTTATETLDGSATAAEAGGGHTTATDTLDGHAVAAQAREGQAVADGTPDGHTATGATLGGEAAAEAERIELIELARELARREIAPAASAIDSGEESALDACWRTICDVGLDRALLAEEHGGAGIAIDHLLCAIEELAVGDGGLALSVLLSNAALASLTPARAADIPPGARWAAVPVGWSAELIVNDRRIEGISLLGLGAHRADGIVLAFPCGAQRPSRPRCSTLYVARGAEGMRISRDDPQLGLRGAPAARVELTGCIGERGEGDEAVTAHIGGGEVAGVCLQTLLRRGAAAVARGVARRAERLASEYALAREQGGVPIVQHDAVSDMLGAMAVRRAGCVPGISAQPSIGALSSGAGHGAPVSRGVGRLGGHPTEAETAIAAKIAASDAAIETCTDAVQVFGGTGYMRETGAEKLMRDAMSLSLFPEPNWVALDELMSARRAGIAAAPASDARTFQPQ